MEFDSRPDVLTKFYLRWLSRCERQEDEGPTLGLFLCVETNREQVRAPVDAQGRQHRRGVQDGAAAQCELEQRLQDILRSARERLARRGLPSSSAD